MGVHRATAGGTGETSQNKRHAMSAYSRGARGSDGRGDAPVRRYDRASEAMFVQEHASGTTN